MWACMVLGWKRHLETSNIFSLFPESSQAMMKNQDDTQSALHIYPDYIVQQKGKIWSNQTKYVIGNASVRNWK